MIIYSPVRLYRPRRTTEKRGEDCWLRKARTESEAINRQIWYSGSDSRLEIMSQSCSSNVHTCPSLRLSVHGGCAPVIQSGPITLKATQTQNVTPDTKCHPSYTDTHKIMQACRHLGLEGTGPGYTLVHSIVLLSSKHRVRQVKESSISIKAISINLLHILNCMTQMSLILTFTGDLYSSLTHYFQM